jgi:hypothetical protein
MSSGHCVHIDAITSVKYPKRRECDGVRENWRHVGPSANLSRMRDDAVLRRLSEPPGQEARPRDGTSRHRIGGAGRASAVLLFGRRVRGMKDGGSSQLCAHTVGRSHGNHNRRARRLSRSTVDQSRRGSQCTQ